MGRIRRWVVVGAIASMPACAEEGSAPGGDETTTAASTSSATETSATSDASSTPTGESSGADTSASSSDADSGSSTGAQSQCWGASDERCSADPPVTFECGGASVCPVLDLGQSERDTTCVFEGLRDRVPGTYRVEGLNDTFTGVRLFEVLADGTALVHWAYQYDFSGCDAGETWVELPAAEVFDACLAETDVFAQIDCVESFDDGPCIESDPICPG